MSESNSISLDPSAPLRLDDGTTIPPIGLGTVGFEGEHGVAIITGALERGYRLLDTAIGYDTEAETGRAVRESEVPREEVVVTTKLRGRNLGYDPGRAAIRESLGRLDLDQIDLYLIHWPMPELGLYVDTWRALVDARADGEVCSIGVSNFTAEHLERIVDATGEVPAVNQIELHPHFPQEEMREVHRRLGIRTESWSPFGRGRELFASEPVSEAARHHGVTSAQVVLRWHQQLGSIPIPRSSDPGRQSENLALDGLRLSEEELEAITALGRSGGRLWGGDPETTGFM